MYLERNQFFHATVTKSQTKISLKINKHHHGYIIKACTEPNAKYKKIPQRNCLFLKTQKTKHIKQKKLKSLQIHPFTPLLSNSFIKDSLS